MPTRRSIILTAAAVALTFAGGPAMANRRYTTEVVVYANGKPSRGRKVSLEFVGGLLPGGFTENVYTDSNGVARVPHASTGRVKVYVDGNHSSHRTTGQAPGRINVYLSK